jgi:hypothetical protein
VNWQGFCAVHRIFQAEAFDLLLGSSVLAVLLLVALIGAFMWLEL